MSASSDIYSTVKTIHILSAAVLFGTGLGIAFFFWAGGRGDDRARLFAARTTVFADFVFTLPAVIVQPVTGALLIVKGGFDPHEPWLVATYALYVVAGLCWLPVVWLQWRIKRMLETKVAGGPFDGAAYERLRRIWFLLGWPAFLGVIVVFWLMVTKPAW